MTGRGVAVLGSTGSIGRQALSVIEDLGMKVFALTAGHNAKLLEEQARRFSPRFAALSDAGAARELRRRLSDTDITVLSGEEGILDCARMEAADTVLVAIVGMAALGPALAAAAAGKRLALANKESLVCAGEEILACARAHGAEVLPVDSEHSAIFQCLEGCKDRGEVKRILLTASGGPFFGRSRAQLQTVTKKDALRHPNWNMGEKITVDSATLMNKGLELIEAMCLFALRPEQIKVVVHRESIVHSLVEFCDNSVLAQLGAPDMRLPIQYALTYPKRVFGSAPPLDLLTCGPLTFYEPDREAFPCLALAEHAARTGGTAAAVLNGANEAAVERFLCGEVSFLRIAELVEGALMRVPALPSPDLEGIYAADRAARAYVKGQRA